MSTSSPNLDPDNFERLAETFLFPTPPWWATSLNPDCVSWCEGEHAPYEFADGGRRADVPADDRG